jgi:PAS domain S-box-containing protein
MEQSTILVVEDERIIAADLQGSLRQLGYNVPAIASTGQSAIDLVEKYHPDLILMDIYLAGEMTGIEAAEKIRLRHNIPVIYLTAFSDSTIIEQAKLCGPYGYLLKPFDEREVRTAIEIALYRHSMDKKLQESEERYRGFVENFLGIAFRMDPGRSPVFLHGAVEAITGYTEEDFKSASSSWESIIYPADRGYVNDQVILAVSEPGYAGSYEYRIVRKDGGIRWVRELVRNIAGPGNKTQYIQGARYDISVSKEAEEQLLKMNDILECRVQERTESIHQQLLFLQHLIDTIPSPVYYKDTQGRYTGCNTAFESFVGYSKQQVIGKKVMDILPENIAGLINEKDILLLKHGGIQVFQVKFPHADHTARDVICKRATFNDSSGAVTGMIGMLLDISDRIRAEEALSSSEKKFREVVQDQTDLIYRYKVDKTVVFANDAFLNYFNTTPKDTIGYIFRLKIHPGDEQRVKDHYASLSEYNPSASVENRVILPDGRVVWQQWNTRAFFNEAGRITEYQSVGRDITDRKEAEHLQKEAYIQIDKNLRQFAGLNDTIRNPLSVIMLLTELNKGPDCDKILENARQIDRIVSMFDRGWEESEKVRQFLVKYYGIGDQNDLTGK